MPRSIALAAAAALGWTCAPAPERPSVAEPPAPAPVRESAIPDDAALPAPPDGESPSLDERPIGARIAARPTVVRSAPDPEAPLLGVIAPGHAFHVHGPSEGPGCPAPGWTRVARAGFACLGPGEPTDAEPQLLPVLAPDRVVPFLYARPRPASPGAAPAPVPRWRHRTAHNRGSPPIDTLDPEGSYAFVRRRANGHKGPLLVDARDRVVPADRMRTFRPSTFAGRDLARLPLPAGRELAWVRRAKTEIFARPDVRARVVARASYHAELELAATAAPDPEWFEVVSGAPPGFLPAAQIRRWSPPPPRGDARSDELWIDVDTGEQTLTVLVGAAPIFATLVSTGKPGDGTPSGLYRIGHKKAWDDMRSDPLAEEPYLVEAVPWVQYFHGDFALHAAYWHDLFGNRTSHGCINVAPRDALWLWGMTAPAVPAGWLALHAPPGAPGTTLRVRHGERPVTDRRTDAPTE